MRSIVLRLIRFFCRGRDCYRCPLAGTSGCRFGLEPCKWEFKGEEALDSVGKPSEDAVTQKRRTGHG